jgi:hypothetical protein
VLRLLLSSLSFNLLRVSCYLSRAALACSLASHPRTAAMLNRLACIAGFLRARILTLLLRQVTRRMKPGTPST